MQKMSEQVEGPPSKRSRLNDPLTSPNDSQGKLTSRPNSRPLQPLRLELDVGGEESPSARSIPALSDYVDSLSVGLIAFLSTSYDS